MGLFVGALAAAIVLPRRWAAGLSLGLALVVSLLAWGPSDYLRHRLAAVADDGDRAQLLRVAWKLWDGDLVWGHGPGSIHRELTGQVLAPGRPDTDLAFHAHLHNTYLQWAVEFGLPAALLPLGLMVALAWMAWRRRRVHPAWAAAALAVLCAFALQAGTDVLTLHARGAAISLWWGLILVGSGLEPA